jgi:hypothetical protein
MQLIDVSPAASAALTNSTTETVLKSHLFPAGFWQVGKVVRARCCVRATATNGADTLAILPRLGAAALTGTSLGGQAALDVADGDVCILDIELVCRTAGTAGVIVGSVLVAKDAPGTVAGGSVVVVSALDLTAATYLGITGQWSAASASDSALAEYLVVSEGSAL